MSLIVTLTPVAWRGDATCTGSARTRTLVLRRYKLSYGSAALKAVPPPPARFDGLLGLLFTARKGT